MPIKDGTLTEFTLFSYSHKLKLELIKGERHVWNCGHLDIDCDPHNPAHSIDATVR